MVCAPSLSLSCILSHYKASLHLLIYCTHFCSVFISPNVFRVSGVTVAQTVFGLQIAGAKPSEIWTIEALFSVIMKTVGMKTVVMLLNDKRHLQLIVDDQLCFNSHVNIEHLLIRLFIIFTYGQLESRVLSCLFEQTSPASLTHF